MLKKMIKGLVAMELLEGSMGLGLVVGSVGTFCVLMAWGSALRQKDTITNKESES